MGCICSEGLIFLMLKIQVNHMLWNHQKVVNQFSKVRTQNLILTSGPGMWQAVLVKVVTEIL
jgi:hypothetical protein